MSDGTMNVYLAARYSRIDELREYRRELQRHGIGVTSDWLDGFRRVEDAALGADPATVDRARAIAIADMADAKRSDIVVSFTEPMRQPTRGGRHVEFGAAYAWGKRLVIVGPGEHVFHRLPGVEIFDEWTEALNFLVALKGGEI